MFIFDVSADSLASEPEQEQITTAKSLLAASNLGQAQYPSLVTPSFVNNILNILRDGAIALATLVPTHVEGMKGADDISSPILVRITVVGYCNHVDGLAHLRDHVGLGRRDARGVDYDCRSTERSAHVYRWIDYALGRVAWRGFLDYTADCQF